MSGTNDTNMTVSGSGTASDPYTYHFQYHETTESHLMFQAVAIAVVLAAAAYWAFISERGGQDQDGLTECVFATLVTIHSFWSKVKTNLFRANSAIPQPSKDDRSNRLLALVFGHVRNERGKSCKGIQIGQLNAYDFQSFWNNQVCNE